MRRARSAKAAGFVASLALVTLLLPLMSCALRAPDRPEPFDPVQSSPDQRARIDALGAVLAPIVAGQPSAEAKLLLELDELYRPLTATDRALLDEIRAQPGGDPDISIPSGIEWVRLEGQVAHTAKGDQPIPLQLVTEPVWHAFGELDQAMRKELGRGLLVGSAYRSPAYQLYLIVEFLPRFDYSLVQTQAHVSLPGASDHNRVERLGIDFVSESGVDLEYSHAADFIALPEYRWLLANAERFGFEPDPVAAGAPVSSPWHWRHVERGLGGRR